MTATIAKPTVSPPPQSTPRRVWPWILAAALTAAPIAGAVVSQDSSFTGDSARINIVTHAPSSIHASVNGKQIRGISALHVESTTAEFARDTCPGGELVHESGTAAIAGPPAADIVELSIDGKRYCLPQGVDARLEGIQIRLVRLTSTHFCESREAYSSYQKRWCPESAELEIGKDAGWPSKLIEIFATALLGVLLAIAGERFIARRRARRDQQAASSDTP